MTHTAFTSKTEYQLAIEQAAVAASAYYNGDEFLIDDATYDGLLRAIAATELAEPSWVTSHGLLEKVAGGQAEVGDAVHAGRMLSLDNVFSASELEEWCQSRNKDLGHSPKGWVVEVKLDGLSIAATYVQGKLTRIATRGDGEVGEDVTYAKNRIPSLPLTLREPVDIEVRGEVLFSNINFELANNGRGASGKPSFVNARNAAAGALRAKTLSYDVTLDFFAHGIHGIQTESWSDAQSQLSQLGIPVCSGLAQAKVVNTAQEVAARVTEIGARRVELPFEIDGAVVKINSLEEQESLGFSSRAPRWAIAYKYPSEEATAKLIAVEWTVGRTGRVTPRAEISPTLVGGTTVTYATLHNADDIKRKDLRIGDTVLVKRAGEVIPRIEAPVVAGRTGTEIEVIVPAVCPRCSGELNRSDAVWRCLQGRRCGLGESVAYAVSRDCLDIEGMGEKIIAQLVEKGLLNDISDIFNLDTNVLAGLDRMGVKSAANIIEQISRSKSQSFSRVLTALGVRMTGRSMSRRLAKHFGSMATLRVASIETLCTVEGVGIERATVIAQELNELSDVIDRMILAGVNMLEIEGSIRTDGPLAGKIVVVSGAMTGVLASLSRNQVNELVERAGGKSSGSVSARTSILVAGEGAGSKLAKASELGVVVLTPEAFASMVVEYID